MKNDPELLADVEECLIEYLLVLFGLNNTRARYKILDFEREFRQREADYESLSGRLVLDGAPSEPERPPMLTMRGWMALFPAFPLWIEVRALSDRDTRQFRLDLPCRVPESSVLRRYVERCAHENLIDADDSGLKRGLVWALYPSRPPRDHKIADMPVVHIWRVSTVEEGAHAQIIMPDPLPVVVCINPMPAVMAHVNDRYPPEDWLCSATSPDYDVPVSGR